MIDTNIKWLHVELSSKCNAWCPACPRNQGGVGIKEGLIEQDLTINRLTEVLKALPNLHGVQLCGNFGDPVMSADFMDAIALIKKNAVKIQIHTNGSIRNEQWWQRLGEELANVEHDIWFGLDGLAGVHEIYRQGTDFNKIIKNASSFIKAGGHATWQFIPYAHNEHQVMDCLRLSQKIGFKKFKLTKLFRTKTIVRHYKTGEQFELSPPITLSTLVAMPDSRNIVNPDNCMHLSMPSVYLGANGTLSTCCYKHSEGSFNSIEELLLAKLDLNNVTCKKSCGA